jgi:hypothetical protein
MYIELTFITEADQHIKVSTDSENPDGVVMVISELDDKTPETRLYLGTKEIDQLYKVLKDVDSYRGIK